MTVPSETSSVNYTGNGATVAFPVTYAYLDEDHLAVKVTPSGGVETTKILGTHYTVSPTADAPTGTVTFLVAPSAGDVVVIERTVPLTQDVAFRSQGSFAPSVHEDALDLEMMGLQQLDRRITTLEGASTTNNAVAGDGLAVSGSTWSVGAGAGIRANADDIEVLFGDAVDLGAAAASAPSAGGIDKAARIDHGHSVDTGNPGAIAIGDSMDAGVATSLARSDHRHSLAAPGAPQDVTRAVASAGSSSSPARADHKHDISTAAPVSIGTGNAEGTATSLARSDHVHNHGAQTDGSLHAVATSGTAGFMSAADKSKLDAIGSTYTGTVQTTDATATVIASRDVASNSLETHVVDVAGYRSTRAEGAAFRVMATFRRDGGTVTQVGTTSTINTDADAGAAAWAVTFAISGTTVLVKVAGEAAKTVNWCARGIVTGATSG